MVRNKSRMGKKLKQNKMKQTKNKANKTWHRLWGDFLMVFSILKEEIHIQNLIKFTLKNVFNCKAVHVYLWNN